MITLAEDPIIQLYLDSFPDVERMVRRKGWPLEEAKDAFHDALLIYMEKEKAGRLQLQASPKANLLDTVRTCWLRARGLRVALTETFDAAERADAGTEKKVQSLRASPIRSGKKWLQPLFQYCQHITDGFARTGFRIALVHTRRLYHQAPILGHQSIKL